jgi:hypothetical protein
MLYYDNGIAIAPNDQKLPSLCDAHGSSAAQVFLSKGLLAMLEYLRRVSSQAVNGLL